MSVWFEGSSEIECNIQQVKHALENYGEHYVGVISLMPGLTSVELVEQGERLCNHQNQRRPNETHEYYQAHRGRESGCGIR